MINAIIMASGFSKRMGVNKLLLEYKGIPIIDHVFKEISKVEFNQIVVVSQYKEILTIGEKYGFITVYNENAHIGQSESIKLGILNSSKCDGYMFFVGDQPLIDNIQIKKILSVFEKNKDCIVIPMSNGRRGNPVVFPYEKKEELLMLKYDEKGKNVINTSKKIKYIDVSENMLFDIDTQDDFNKLLSQINK